MPWPGPAVSGSDYFQLAGFCVHGSEILSTQVWRIFFCNLREYKYVIRRLQDYQISEYSA